MSEYRVANRRRADAGLQYSQDGRLLHRLRRVGYYTEWARVIFQTHIMELGGKTLREERQGRPFRAVGWKHSHSKHRNR